MTFETSSAVSTLDITSSWEMLPRSETSIRRSRVEHRGIPAATPVGVDEIRAWIAGVELPSPMNVDPRLWPHDAVMARWEKVWEPVFEEAEQNPPSYEEIRDAKSFASKLSGYQNLDGLTPAQLAIYLRPMMAAVARMIERGRTTRRSREM